jgi:hypothetical protein
MALKEPTSNELIPILLTKFDEYTNKIKDRIKIDSMFSEFNEKTRSEFSKFIKMSQLRYKGIKSGSSLENMLEKQKPKYNQLSKKILDDIFYNTNDIDDENKKLLKKPSKKENQDIADLRREIIFKTRDFTKNEIRNRERLEKIVMKKRLEIKQREQNKTFSRFNFNYEPNSIKKKSPKRKIEIEREESKHFESSVGRYQFNLVKKKKDNYWKKLMEEKVPIPSNMRVWFEMKEKYQEQLEKYENDEFDESIKEMMETIEQEEKNKKKNKTKSKNKKKKKKKKSKTNTTDL